MDDRHLNILLELKQSVGGLHEKTDAVAKSFEKHEKEDEVAHMRISSLEESRSNARGGYAVLVVAVAVISSLFTMLTHAFAGK